MPFVEDLSDREREVLYLVAHGLANKEIATRLDISVKSVETYRLRAMTKLKLSTRADLVRLAIEEGWLERPLRLSPTRPVVIPIKRR